MNQHTAGGADVMSESGGTEVGVTARDISALVCPGRRDQTVPASLIARGSYRPVHGDRRQRAPRGPLGGNMHHRTTRRLAAAISIGLSAALATTLGLAAPAQAAERGETRAARAAQLTDFGYRGDVYGVK